MYTLILFFIVWLVWFSVGCAVLSFIDDENSSLFKWASSCPIPIIGYPMVVTMWPLLAWAWLHREV